MTKRTFILRFALPTFLVALNAAQLPAQTPAKPQTDSPPRYYIGVAVESIPPLMAEQLQLVEGQGLNIQRVIANSPAASADLQPSDLIIVVNDSPLTSQKQLNDNIHADQIDGKWQPKPVTIEFLRKGVHHTVTLIPAPRPENLLASGPPANINSSAAPKTYAGADGVVHQVGTGYLIDIRNSNAVINKSISSLTLGDQPVILSQESDAAGHVKTTVTMKGKTQEIDPAHLDALPEDLRNLVKPLLAPAPPPTDLEQMQDKLRQQDQQIKELQQQLKELLKSQPQK